MDFGPNSVLGLGKNSSEWVDKFTYLNIDNISSLHVLNGLIVVVKKDGTVWGTGSNSNGVLGRWIGVGRSTTGSRYKTAINWVRCPELEM